MVRYRATVVLAALLSIKCSLQAEVTRPSSETIQLAEQINAEQQRAQALEEECNFAAAVPVNELLYKLNAELFGLDHWRTQAARTCLIECRSLSKLNPDKIDILKEVKQLQSEARALHKSGCHKEAVDKQKVAACFLMDTVSDHTIYIKGASELAASCYAAGDLNLSEELYSKIYRVALARKSSPVDLAGTLLYLARVQTSAGKFDRAERNLKRAIRIYETCADHLAMLAYMDLSKVYISMNRFDDAGNTIAQLRAVSARSCGKESFYYIESLHLQARLTAAQGKFAQAITLCNQSIEILERTLGTDHPGFIDSLLRAAAMYLEASDAKSAIAQYSRVVDLEKAAGRPTSVESANALIGLGQVYLETEELDRAEDCLNRALPAAKESSGTRSALYISCLSANIEVHRRSRAFEKGQALAVDALSLARSSIRRDEPAYLEASLSVGKLDRDIGKVNEATSLLEDSRDIALLYHGRQSMTYVKALCALANLKTIEGKKAEGDALLDEASALAVPIVGEDRFNAMASKLAPR